MKFSHHIFMSLDRHILSTSVPHPQVNPIIKVSHSVLCPLFSVSFCLSIKFFTLTSNINYSVFFIHSPLLMEHEFSDGLFTHSPWKSNHGSTDSLFCHFLCLHISTVVDGFNPMGGGVIAFSITGMEMGDSGLTMSTTTYIIEQRQPLCAWGEQYCRPWVLR